MKKLLTVSAYLWAVVCLVLIPVVFFKNDTLASQLATLPFMKVHPKYSGGELNRKYEKDSLVIMVNKPVNIALFGDKRQMVQMAFSRKGNLPGLIDQTVDYNFDNNPDFKVTINTTSGETNLTPLDQTVKSLSASSRVKDDWVIRVNLEHK
jgi:hypothetical protein